MREGWTYKRFTEVCDVQYGYPFDSKCFTDDSNYMPLIRIRDVQRGYSDTFYSGEIPDGYTIQEGDYLVGMDGEFNIGIWGKRPGVLNQRVCKMTSSSDFLVNKYMFYFLKVCLKKIEDETPFVTVKHLSAKRINQIEIPLPPKSQQEAIVSELDEIYSLLALKREQLQKYDKLAQSLFYEMFGDPVENEKGWEVSTLGNIAYIGLGFTHTPKYVDKGVAFLSVKDVSSGQIVWDNIHYVSEEEYLSAPKGAKPNKGDILFCRVGTMGKPLIIDTDIPFCTFVSLGYLHLLSETMVNVYVKYWMQSEAFDLQVAANVKGLAIKNLNTGWLKNFIIQIPPLPLQQQFASRIEQIESQKQQVQAAIEKLETLLASRMQYWFE